MKLKLKAFRKKLNITQKEIAAQLGVSFQTYSAWETERTEPSADMLKKLADIFGTTVDELIGHTFEIHFFDDARIERPEILDIFEKLTPVQQENLLNYARGMAASNELLKGEQSSKKSDIA